jgi:DHA2 family multidrug resistance protein
MASSKGFTKFIIVLTTVSAAIMELIDTSIVNVGLNQMAGNLGASIEDIAWVITSYAIANVIIIPMTGFLGEYFGRKNYYIASMILFTLASFLCGNSHSLWELVFWRFIQGIGGGALLSTSQSILFDAFEPHERPIASGLFGMGIVLGPTLGPTLGGIIIDNYDWPMIFNINLPIGIIATFLTVTFVDRKPGEGQNRKNIKIDFPGIALLIAGVGSLQYILEKGESEDWFDSRTITLLSILSAVSLISFVYRQLTITNPVVNLKVLSNRNLALTCVFTFIAGFGLFTSVFVYPVLVQRIMGYTPTMTGLSLIPGSLVAVVMMPLIGKQLQKGADPKMFVFVGFLIFAFYAFVSSSVNADASSHDFLFPLLMRGIGISLCQLPLINQAVSGLQPRDYPAGIAINNMVRQLGGSFGIALANNYIASRAAIHRVDLVSNLYASNPLLVDRINNLSKNFMSASQDAAAATQQAYQVIELAVVKQSYLLSYLDTFKAVGFFFIIALPLVFLIEKKPKMDPKMAAKAAEEAH